MSEKFKVGMTAEQAWEFQNGRIAGLIQQLIEKDARIAELESREVKLPDVEKWRSPEAVRAQNAYRVLVGQELSAAGIKGE